MNNWTISGACALFLVACTAKEPPAGAAGTPATAPAANTTAVVMELGKDI